MPRQPFGFLCGEFSVSLSGNKIILPGSKNQPLKKSLLPYAGMNDTAGPFTLRVVCDGKVVCEMPVHVVWAGHQSQPEPFLGIKTDNPEELLGALAVYVGKRVELEFLP